MQTEQVVVESRERDPATDAVVIAGGYGIVGAEVARILRDRHPELPLVLAGRRPTAGQAVADEVAAAVRVFDASAPDELVAARPRAVLAAVNDVDDRLLLACARHGVPFVDITRWTALVARAALRLAPDPPSAPVVLSSGWMGGVVPLLGRHAGGDELQIAIRYALADRSGPDSVDYVDRLDIPFEVVEDGVTRIAVPLRDGRQARWPDGTRSRAVRIDTPEQATLPLTIGARTVATRIAFDSRTATTGLVVLARLGILARLPTGLRRRLLHAPGDGGEALVVVQGATEIVVRDPAGQAHLTACGAAIALEWALGLGDVPPPEGVAYPEGHPHPDRALALLADQGVEVRRG